MNKRLASCLLALFVPALAAAVACGGGQSNANQPSNPPAASASAAPAESSSAAAAESAAPASSAAPAASASAAPAAPPGPPGPGDWDKWSHEQKLAYMKSDVMPKMGKVFHDFDAKKYDEPKCVLCHGEGVKDGSFKMPNPALPKLDASPAAFKALATKHPKIYGFMSKQVAPTMAGLLGEQPYDMKTQQGFGCFNCHTKK
jgi:hypothetical protein